MNRFSFVGALARALTLSTLLVCSSFAANPFLVWLEETAKDAGRASQTKDAGKLAETIAKFFKFGQQDEAILTAQQAAAMERADGAADAAARFDQIANKLDAFRVQRSQIQQILQTLPLEKQVSLTAFETVTGPISRIAKIPADVRKFLRAFRRSADNPEAYVEQMTIVQKLHVGIWNMTDRSKRVFLAGSGEDTPEVMRIRKGLEDAGYVVFFYQFCEGPTGELCDSEIVGSYFKSAGQAYLVDTPAAARSRYVLAELQMALP